MTLKPRENATVAQFQKRKSKSYPRLSPSFNNSMLCIKNGDDFSSPFRFTLESALGLQLPECSYVPTPTSTIEYRSIVIQSSFLIVRQCCVEKIEDTEGKSCGSKCRIIPVMDVVVLHVPTIVATNLTTQQVTGEVSSILIREGIPEVCVRTYMAVDRC